MWKRGGEEERRLALPRVAVDWQLSALPLVEAALEPGGGGGSGTRYAAAAGAEQRQQKQSSGSRSGAAFPTAPPHPTTHLRTLSGCMTCRRMRETLTQRESREPLSL